MARVGGHSQRRDVEQTPWWCYHCSGWTAAQHSGSASVEEDWEASHEQGCEPLLTCLGLIIY